MNILLTNDDGFDALGVISLKDALQGHNVCLLGPAVEQSAKGHSFTMGDPLRLMERSNKWYSLTGTPADCTYFGLNFLFPEADVVVSGMNMGANLGQDTYYSGTVAAAREAFFNGRKAFAISLLENVTYESQTQKQQIYARAAECAVHLIERLVAQLTQPALWNINIPASCMLDELPPRITIQPLGHRDYARRVVERQDSRGHSYFWIGGPPQETLKSDTDVYWCEQGYVVLTPLQMDCTDQEQLRQWQNRAFFL